MVEIKKLKPLFKNGWHSRLYKGREWAGSDYAMYDVGQPPDGEEHSSLFGVKPESVRDDVRFIADGVKGSPATPVALMDIGGRKLAVFEVTPGMAVFAKAEFVVPVAGKFPEADNTFFLDGNIIRVCGNDERLIAIICVFKPSHYDVDKLAEKCEYTAGLMKGYIRYGAESRAKPRTSGAPREGRPMSEHQVFEVCPHCENEVVMNWDVTAHGYQSYCPYCGKRLMLCDECVHSESGIPGECDYDSVADCCSRQERK